MKFLPSLTMIFIISASSYCLSLNSVFAQRSSSFGKQQENKMPSGLFDQNGTQWAPFLEWSLANASFSGNPFDLIATVTFTHSQSSEIRTTEMFYDGDSTWKFRFSGTQLGTWTFTTSSSDPELDSLSGAVTIQPNSDPNIKGFLVARGTKFARQTGIDGKLIGEIPKVYMNLAMTEIDGAPFPMSLMSRPGVRSEYIQEALDNGHNAIFLHVNNQWFEWDAISYRHHNSEDPDPASFQVIETFITEAHQTGLQTVIWAWGDEERQWTPASVGGINGIPDQRIQRYIAARLGPLPGWSMGYGFDLLEWTTENDLKIWVEYLRDHFGWQHLLWARQHSNNELAVVSNDVRATGVPQDEFYRVAVAAMNASKGRPVIFARRFAYLRDDAWTMDNTRRSMWQFAMAGGAAGWWGFFDNSPYPYPHPEQLQTHESFWQNRFLLGFQIDNWITDGCALRLPANTHFVFYKEDAISIQIDLSAMNGRQSAIAVDTKLPYREINLGDFNPILQTWVAPYQSDWALAVGDFSDSSGSDTTPPVISNVKASAITTTTATITWDTDEPSDSQVTYDPDTNDGNTTPLDTTLVRNHSQNLAGLSPNTLYRCRVLSKDLAGNLAVSRDFTFTTPALPIPNPPGQLVATANNSSTMTLSWEGDSSGADGFKIERKQGSGSFIEIAKLGAHMKSYTDKGLHPNTHYTYRVFAYNGHGHSDYSNVATAKTYPTFMLTLNKVGDGNVSTSPPGSVYDSSAVVTLTAIPNSDWQFSGWRGGLTGTGNPATLTMNANKNIMASFSKGRRATDGLLVLYNFQEGSGDTIRDVSGFGAPLNLTISDTNKVRWIPGGGLHFISDSLQAQSPGAATKLYNRLIATNALSVEAWALPDNLTQTGPARIVSYSTDAQTRNFTLGQEAAGLAMRLHTPQSGPNGANPDLAISGVITTELQHLMATFDGSTVRLYVDGVAQQETLELAGGFAGWDASSSFVLGNETTPIRQWLGSLYLVAVYDRALTSDEVLRNFKAGLSTFSNQEEAQIQEPARFMLYPNYPNPFNAGTKIRFNLPDASRVSIIVFNLLGERVAVLIDGYFAAGNHSINFNPTNLSSGIYIYVLQTENFRETRRMLYLK